MQQIRIGAADAKAEKEERQSAVFLFFLAAGVYGILFSLHAVEEPVWQESTVYTAAGLLCVGVWYTFYYKRKLFYGLAGLAAVLWGVAWILAGTELSGQFARIFRSFSGTGAGDAGDGGALPVTGAVLFVTTVLVFGLAVLEFRMGSHWIVYAFTTGILLVSPVFGIPVGMPSVILLSLFQIFFWAVQAVRKRKRKKRFSGGGSGNLAGKCSAVTGGILLVCLIVSFLAVAPNTEQLYQSVYAAEGFVYRGLRQISGQADEPVVSGAVSGRNNYRTGTPQLEVIVTDQPEETLYLKGFTGGEYTGGSWDYADENELFASMADLLEWQEWESWIGAMYSTMYFTLNAETMRRDAPEPSTMAIRQTNGKLYALYHPYYCRWNRQVDPGEEWYAFDYFEEKDMNVAWDDLYATFGRAADWYQAIRASYEMVIRTAYTGVPEELLPRLTELCRGNPMEGTEEVTAFIVSVLESYASYTLTPGNAPLNEDIVEYFLFENHEGYCVHFASAATLIYRLYDIPARYAAGYALTPDDFEQQDDGTWRAVVTDESAHAWTEIFLEDYGWTPVEVTPSDTGAIAAVYPGLSESALSEAVRGLSLNTGSGGENGEAQSASESSRLQKNGAADFHFDGGAYEELLLLLASFLLELLCLFPLVLPCVETWKYKRLEKMNCRRLFTLLLKAAEYAGGLSGYTGEEEDFPEKFASALPCISVPEAERLQEIVSRAAYSPRQPSDGETQWVRELFLRAAEYTYENSGRWKRLRFRY